MPNIKSAKKRMRQSIVRRDRNRKVKTTMRTMIKRASEAITQDPKSAEEAVKTALRTLDKTAQKGVVHKNLAARKKSRIMNAYNKALAAK